MIEYVGVAVENGDRGFLGTVPDFGFFADGYSIEDVVNSMAAYLRLILKDTNGSYLTVLSPRKSPVTVEISAVNKMRIPKSCYPIVRLCSLHSKLWGITQLFKTEFS